MHHYDFLIADVKVEPVNNFIRRINGYKPFYPIVNG